MGKEIERKYLVTGSHWRSGKSVHIRQGYLSRAANRTVRVRIAADSAFLTIKGATTGATRAEFEYAIPADDAQQLLSLCEGSIIEKYRHTLDFAGLTWEVDDFRGDNAGLVVAEVELETEEQDICIPDWVGMEVTDDSRYFNSALSEKPYCRWQR